MKIQVYIIGNATAYMTTYIRDHTHYKNFSHLYSAR